MAGWRQAAYHQGFESWGGMVSEFILARDGTLLMLDRVKDKFVALFHPARASPRAGKGVKGLVWHSAAKEAERQGT